MMIKIHKEIPASFKLRLLANAVVATRTKKPVVNNVTNTIFTFDISIPPFFWAQDKEIAFRVPILKKHPIYEYTIEFINFFII